MTDILSYEIRKKVLDIICEQFSVSENEITDETGPGDLAKWDSIGQLRLIMELEKGFNIQLSVDDVMSINNFRDIVGAIRKLSDFFFVLLFFSYLFFFCFH